MRMNSTRLPQPLWVGIALALIPLACNAPMGPDNAGGTVAAFPFLTLTAQAANPPAGVTLAATETPDTGQPTATLQPGVTPSPTVCTYSASFVADVTIPDETQFAAGAAFDKTWRMRNNGCLDWPDGARLAFFEGEQMGGLASVPVRATQVNETVDITVSLRAPSQPGGYTGYWQLQSPAGVSFGDHVYVTIIVKAATLTPTVNTATPTQVTPTLTPSITLTATPTYLPFLGNWINATAQEGEISRVLIRESQGRIMIQVWTKCGSSNCSYGETSTPASDANDGMLQLNWVKEGYTESQQFTLQGNDQLKVEGEINYTDANLQDKDYTITLTES